MQPKTWSISALSVELGLDRRTLARLLADISPAEEKHLKNRTEKRWILRDVLDALEAPATDDTSLDEARRRKLAAEAALAELELRKARGELVSIEDVSREWLDITTAARSKLLSLPAKMAAVVAPVTDLAEIRGLLEAEVIEALEELSRFGESG